VVPGRTSWAESEQEIERRYLNLKVIRERPNFPSDAALEHISTRMTIDIDDVDNAFLAGLRKELKERKPED